MIRVLHFQFTAVLGRYPKEQIVKLFKEQDVELILWDKVPKEIRKNASELVSWCNQNKIDWLYWGWEKETTELYRKVFESSRRFKIFMFGQEQPQALNLIRTNSKYADFTLTSSPVYKNEVNGFLPFGIHTHYFKQQKKDYLEKENKILISGSYRHSRGQMFDLLLKKQPFKWPVYLFPPRLTEDLVQKDLMRKIVAASPKYVYKAAGTHWDYIPNLLNHQNNHKIFIDFTTNTTNYIKFHEDLFKIMEDAEKHSGGYCPERVLDALWLGTNSVCFEDKAVRMVLGDTIEYYKSFDQLVFIVNSLIENETQAIEKSQNAKKYVERFTTEKVIEALSTLFKTGKFYEL